MLQIPGKIGIDGSMVEQMHNEGKIQDIRDYCELDVLNTYLVYLRYSHHTGTISNANYNRAVEDLLTALREGINSKPHFKLFLSEWQALNNAPQLP